MVFAIFIAFSTNGFAASGLFDAYAIFSLDGGANTYRQYSAVQDWSIGSFTYGSSSLILNGAQNRTYKNGSSNVTGGQLAYRVYLTSAGSAGVPFSFINLGFGEDYGTPGDQRWETNNANINLLSGRDVGSYTIEVYFQAYTSDGDSYYSNSGLNYKATFTITAATPTLTTPPIATSIAYGQTLASSTLSGGAASVAGSFAFTTPSTAPSAGTASQSVTFTPTDTTNYNTFTTTVNVTVSDITTYTSSWDFGTPTVNLNAVIAGDYTSGSFTAKSLTVNATKTLTVATGTSVTVAEALINNGTITVQNNANLVQTAAGVSTNSGSGTATVTRNSNPLFREDYTMWSSPVSGAQTLLNFSPATLATRFYTYDYALGVGTGLYTAFASPSTTTFTTGTGYLIRMPDTGTALYNTKNETLAYPGVFTGTANNGTVTLGFPVALATGEFYAVGNPYPSTISASAFVTGNPNAGGTLYFWRKTNGTPNTTSSYATWTTMGGVAGSNVAPNNVAPDGTIAVGQGFIVSTGTATTLEFTNAMRTGNNSAQFFKTKQLAQKDRVWLNLTNTSGAFSQALIGFVDGATNGFDNGIDGKSINDSPIALTSSINNEEYTIQGRPAFVASDVVALNFKTDVVGDFTIAIDHVDGLFSGSQDIYLVDSKTGTETNLKTSSYTFTAAAAVDNTRFSLKFQKTLSLDAQELNDNSVIVYKNGGVIYVNSGAKTINNIKVFDILGRVVAERNNVKANTASIQNLRASNQVLIVKVTTDDNQVISKKVEN